MTNISKKFVAGIATVALVANGLVPVAFAGTTIEITGNGAGSDNYANVSQTSTTTVQQSNDADIENEVNSNASTGGNDANYNVGGDVSIDTGNASTETTVTNMVNTNQAQVNCCAAGSTEVKISGNGANSDNDVQLTQGTKTTIEQDNDADVENEIEAEAKTGYNDAYKNVGGDVSIHTGSAKVSSEVSTVANVNSARVMGGTGSHPTASFWITGNGAGSDNYINGKLTNSTVIDQDNDADVENEIEAEARTGENEANYNVGGDVMIDTGKAEIMAEVDNSVNFNYADADCGCTWDVLAKISGNGAEDPKKESDADNTITLKLDTKQTFEQDNDADLENELEDLYAKTGYNDAWYNNGEADSDPSITTGDASVNTGVGNEGNVNVIGDMMDWEMPEMPEVDFSFNFSAMMAFFGFWM